MRQLIKSTSAGSFYVETVTDHPDGKPLSRLSFMLEDDSQAFLYASEIAKYPELAAQIARTQEELAERFPLADRSVRELCDELSKRGWTIKGNDGTLQSPSLEVYAHFGVEPNPNAVVRFDRKAGPSVDIPIWYLLRIVDQIKADPSKVEKSAFHRIVGAALATEPAPDLSPQGGAETADTAPAVQLWRTWWQSDAGFKATDPEPIAGASDRFLGLTQPVKWLLPDGIVPPGCPIRPGETEAKAPKPGVDRFGVADQIVGEAVEAIREIAGGSAWNRRAQFNDRLRQLLNEVSAENDSNTPDHILARYLIHSLANFDNATIERDKFYSFDPVNITLRGVNIGGSGPIRPNPNCYAAQAAQMSPQGDKSGEAKIFAKFPFDVDSDGIIRIDRHPLDGKPPIDITIGKLLELHFKPSLDAAKAEVASIMGNNEKPLFGAHPSDIAAELRRQGLKFNIQSAPPQGDKFEISSDDYRRWFSAVEEMITGLERIDSLTKPVKDHLLPTAEDRPNGLHQRYRVLKLHGTTDPNAVYFVLRLDPEGDDKFHVKACRIAALAYANAVKDSRLHFVGEDLRALIATWCDVEALRNTHTERMIDLAKELTGANKHPHCTNCLRILPETGVCGDCQQQIATATVRCSKCGKVPGEFPRQKYCGDGSDKDNAHDWKPIK